MLNLVEGREVRVDLGACGGRYFCTVAACGFDAEVSEMMREGRRLPGTAGYLWAALRHLFRFEPAKVTATGEFGRLETEVLLVAAAVTQSYGGGMRIAPHADPADGRFDVVFVGSVARRTVAAMLPRLFRGGHTRHPAVRIERSSFLEIETEGGARPLYADGEPLGKTPVALRTAAGFASRHRSAGPHRQDEALTAPTLAEEERDRQGCTGDHSCPQPPLSRN